MGKSKAAKQRAKDAKEKALQESQASQSSHESQSSQIGSGMPTVLPTPPASGPQASTLGDAELAGLEDVDWSDFGSQETTPLSSQPQTPSQPKKLRPGVPNASMTHPSMQNASLDDMALELLVAKEAESEVDQLKKEVARLKKEIEFKDGVIARLQAQQQALSPTGTGKPSLGDTVVHQHTHTPREAGLQCVVCVDYFVFPYTVECGHTFCYTCLHSWLEVHKSCPTCRTKLLRRPTLSFIVRDQVQSAVSRLPEPDKSSMLKKIEAESKSIKQIQTNGDLWEGIFRPVNMEGIGNTIVDADDGVRRCGSCGWEVRGGVCTHCSNMFSDVEVSDDSQDHSQEDSEPDDYDSHDSFINDSDNGQEENSDQDHGGNDLYLSDSSLLISDDGSNTPRTRSTRSKVLRKKKSKRMLASDDSDGEDTQPVELSSDDEEEEVEKDEDEEEEDEVLVRNKPRRVQNKRAIMISDDDDEEVESIRRRRKRRNVALEISSDDDDQRTKAKNSKISKIDDNDDDSVSETVESDDDTSRSESEADSESSEVDSDDDFVTSKNKDKKSKKSKKDKSKRKKKVLGGGLEALFA
ncbi:E3 ubiquitin ligase [Podila verticillata]|nr:E3 ubiquitin ligase [Podila verticillata]